jgi:hypothetical protein
LLERRSNAAFVTVNRGLRIKNEKTIPSQGSNPGRWESFYETHRMQGIYVLTAVALVAPVHAQEAVAAECGSRGSQKTVEPGCSDDQRTVSVQPRQTRRNE